jgi:hypothetical protein
MEDDIYPFNIPIRKIMLSHLGQYPVNCGVYAFATGIEFYHYIEHFPLLA